MFEQARRVREPLGWGRRERVIVATVVTVVAALALALVGYALTSGGPARRGCVEITFASTLGGAHVHECGARARAICASPGAYREAADELRASCTRAGYRYGGG